MRRPGISLTEAFFWQNPQATLYQNAATASTQPPTSHRQTRRRLTPPMAGDPPNKHEREDPPPIKTKLHFKRASSNPSTHNKRRKSSASQENKKPRMNGAESKRHPDFDFTNDDDLPLPKISKVFWPDKYTFKDALFSALTDPDDAVHWAQVFGADIHIYPRPRATMSDDEYASWVREQVYAEVLRESHRRKADAAKHERARADAKARQQREKEEQEYFERQRQREQEWQKKWQQRFNTMNGDMNGTYSRPTENSAARNLRSQAPMQRWQEYLAAFQPPPPDANLDLLLLWQQSDVPWPTPSGLEKDISEEHIRQFIRQYTMKYSEQAAGDWKKAVRQNQYYWHPDKFRQIQARKLEKLSDDKKEEIMSKVTEVSQILNKLAKESG